MLFIVSGSRRAVSSWKLPIYTWNGCLAEAFRIARPAGSGGLALAQVGVGRLRPHVQDAHQVLHGLTHGSVLQ